MGYQPPPLELPPPKFIQYNAGYAGLENPKQIDGWHFSTVISKEKQKTVDDLLEEGANYDPLTQIKNGKFSFLKLEQEKIDRAQRLGIILEDSPEYLEFLRKIELVKRVLLLLVGAAILSQPIWINYLK